jgi:hypothetical protein
VPDLVIAVVQGRTRIRQQRGEARLGLNQRPHVQIFAVEVQKIEQEEDERGGIAAVGYRLEARMHAVAVELDLVQPLRTFRRWVEELGELRLDPLRQTGAGAPGYRPRHGGGRLLRRRAPDFLDPDFLDNAAMPRRLASAIA